ncbi:lytic murein transglycosylase [Aliiruegeria lutimaris]|uniref:Membrane-bound lytic murein transglycosylase B n=1 Tax=Aliiruegeria lutimaris TaxID=571298 RepID=A0A1G8VST5_9RHOB|nr:lytic murein transglycosylase [Aliiruegeria lutimaris]SDJ69084.1 membrane-bound lytic murein transglycosylase B [Aliiruegeria lutimaris]
MTRPAFDAWIAEFRQRALRAGLLEDVLDSALAGLEPNASAIEKDSNQAEFTRPVWDYLDMAVSADRVCTGRVAMTANAALFAGIKARFAVPSEIVAAIWGVETRFGAIRGAEPVLPALATLAWEGRRAAFFESELLAALEILQAGDVGSERMLGSWAGAMGHTQFMPSTYLQHAVDFDEDGRRDIWGDDPSDALASAASYLSKSGWADSLRWGAEVRLPDGFDLSLTGRQTWKPVREWQALGVAIFETGALAQTEPAALLLPAGHAGPAFCLSRNFEVLRRYNASDAYALAVSLLADRLAGRGALHREWPRGLRLPDRAQLAELQRLLTGMGFDTQGADGLAGPNTAAAIRAYQRVHALPADGFATLDLLDRMRRS